jgi:hypothetical protein
VFAGRNANQPFRHMEGRLCTEHRGDGRMPLVRRRRVVVCKIVDPFPRSVRRVPATES